MSFVFGSTFQDENAENQGPRRGKRIENTTVPARNNAPKRAALGVITNQVRVQPSRAAKPAKVSKLVPVSPRLFIPPCLIFKV